jgi:hypothetical protein
MARRYSKSAGRKVAKVMRERKRGTLRSGSSGKKVSRRKQAVAIGLSEARRAGEAVPPPPGDSKSSKKSSGKKSSKKKSSKKSSRRSKSSRSRRR